MGSVPEQYSIFHPNKNKIIILNLTALSCIHPQKLLALTSKKNMLLDLRIRTIIIVAFFLTIYYHITIKNKLDMIDYEFFYFVFSTFTCFLFGVNMFAGIVINSANHCVDLLI